MSENEIANAVEETIETYEFTDDNGQEHCFVVESKFKVGNDDYVALLEVDPSIFAEEEEGCGCGCEHDHDHAENCCDGHDHDEEVEEDTNIILAKVVTDENGEVDIQVPSDEEFEKAKQVYENLEA